MGLRIQACDTFSALNVSHVQYINLLTTIFGTTQWHIIERNEATLVASLHRLEN